MVKVSKQEQELLDERQRCRTDKLFLAEQLGYDFVPSVHSELFSQYIPFDNTKPWAEQSETTKRMILWPRGFFKTTSIIVEIIQIILNFPDIRILIMRGNTANTCDLMKEIRAHFTGDNPKSRLPELFPEYCASRLDDIGQNEKGVSKKRVVKGNVMAFTVPARKNKGIPQATVTVATPRSIKTGQHFDVGFFDDLVHDQNYRSPHQLKKTRDDFFMYMPLLDPPHYAYVTGTRYAFGDLYEWIQRYNKGWQISIKTCWTAGGKCRFEQVKTRDGRIVGFTREGLLAIREADPGMFASQYLNQPVASAQQQFTTELLQTAVINPSDAPALSPAIMVIDLAASDSTECDDSVILVGRHDDRHKPYIVDARGDQWLPPMFAHNVIEMALKYRPFKIMFENTPSCKYFTAYLETVARQQNLVLPIDYIKVDNKADAKKIRISSLTGLIKTGQLKFFTGLSCWDKIVKQFVEYPGSRHDDYPDTVALLAGVFMGEAAKLPIIAPAPKNIMELFAAQEKNNATELFKQHKEQEMIIPDDQDGYFGL